MSIKYRKLEFIIMTIVLWLSTIYFYFFMHFTIGAVFFLVAAIFNTAVLLGKKSHIELLSNKKYKKEMAMSFEERKVDVGIFEYYDTGFVLNFQNSIVKIEWASIKALFGYKVDLLTVDEICLDIFYKNNKQIRITEDTKGWYIFLQKLCLQFPTININWNAEIALPAFETNLTLLYEFENKNLEESSKYYY